MDTETLLIETIDNYKNGKISRKEAITKMVHTTLIAAHELIKEFESSEEHEIGIPVSDLFESKILLPLAFQLE